LKFVTFTLSNMKRLKEASAHATRYLAEHGEDVLVLDVLKVACFYSGSIDEAVRYGQRRTSVARGSVRYGAVIRVTVSDSFRRKTS